MFFFITSSHTFFIAPKLSQNDFKNQIVWEVLVGEVLVVGEVEKRAWILEDVHFHHISFPCSSGKVHLCKIPYFADYYSN